MVLYKLKVALSTIIFFKSVGLIILLRQGEQHSIKEITMFFEKKEPYLNALLGVHGSNGFYERFKTEFIFELEENDPLKNDRITPYLIEFHISSIISLYRLWLRRQKDLTLEEFTDLMHRLLYDVNISPIY